MKRTNVMRRVVMLLLAVVLCATAIFATSCMTGSTTPIDYTKLGTVADAKPTELKDLKWAEGRIASGSVSGETAGKLIAATGFYYTESVIVVPMAKTTVTLTISKGAGNASSEGVASTYLILSSYSLNNSQAWQFNEKGANYNGTIGSAIPLDSGSVVSPNKDGDKYTLTYVTGSANEAIRLCIPAEAVEDISVTVLYTPNAVATFTPKGLLPNWASLLIRIAVIGLLIFLFYFFVMRPQRKQEKKNAEMRDQVAVGDEITTVGGIIGEVISIKDETVTLETGRDKAQIRILKNRIQTVDVRAADKNASAAEKPEA